MTNQSLTLQNTRCAICGTEQNADTLYPANFGPEAFNSAVFSARRLPDRLHYQLVKCRTCGLVRSDPVAPPELLAQLYRQSTFTYGSEVANLQTTYGRYLAKLLPFRSNKGALLEIGCGNGFFLEEALDQGYAEVCGVEPSQAAIDAANPRVKAYLRCEMMRPELFPPNRFDVICLFQVFDHVSEPATLLADCLQILKPGGLILCFNHNVEALSARLLGERSPIVDIEHTYLYSLKTMTKLFEKQGFNVLEVAPAQNVYNVQYLSRLLPLPGGMKHFALNALEKSRLGRIKLWVSLGNLYLIGQKPIQ